MPPPSLDHLILFLPVDPTNRLPSLPRSITQNFTLTPGGFHSDGLTSNILITLFDGCYIELITFISPSSSAQTHWWGPSSTFTGWKDWCLTTSTQPEENYSQVKKSHAQPVHGGRQKASGEEVKWAVTFPVGENGGQATRGRVPFFCHDVTQREIRVPREQEKMAHKCRALGVLRLCVVVRDQALLEETRAVYAKLLNQEGEAKGDEVLFHLARVHDIEGLGSGTEVVLRLPRNENEVTRVKEKGFLFGDVVLGARDLGAKLRGIVRLDGEGKGEEGSLGGLYVQYLE